MLSKYYSILQFSICIRSITSFDTLVIYFQLKGYNQPAILQLFIGSDTGKVRPHGFYQAYKVYGKNSTQCNERDIDGTVVIEIQLLPEDEMRAR